MYNKYFNINKNNILIVNMTDIRILLNNVWQKANSEQESAYQKYINDNRYVEQSLNINGIHIYRPENDPFNPIYMDYQENRFIPIIDWNNIKVFLLDVPDTERPNWFQARNYQAWSYIHFIYNNVPLMNYSSRGTPLHLIKYPNTFIDIPNLQPEIVFTISRNNNNSVYYERNDNSQRRFRICDNERARSGYLGWYTRMTMPIPMSFSYENVVNNYLVLPTQQTEITNIEEEQCILCYKNKKNIKFIPCEHLVICASCYPKLNKSTECIICKNTINELKLA